MEFDAKVVRVDYSSLTRPPSVMDYNPAARTLSLVKQRPCPGYSPKDYTCRRIMVTVRDGTQVPVSLVYKTSTWPKGDAPPPKPLPLHLYGCVERPHRDAVAGATPSRATHVSLPPPTGTALTAYALSPALTRLACATLTVGWCTPLPTSVAVARWVAHGTSLGQWLR